MNTPLFKKVSLILVMAIGILSILLLVPVTDSFVEHSKSYVLMFGALLVSTLFIIKTFRERAVRVAISPITGALLFFALATIASTFFTSNYPVEGLLGLGGVFLSTSIIALLGGNIMPRDITEKFLGTLAGSSVVLVALSVAQSFGFGPAQLLNKTMGFAIPSSLIFNLAGSPFIALQVVGLTLVAVIAHVVSTKKLSKFFAVSLPILVIGTGIFAWSLLPGKETSLVLPSFSASWSVMLDTIRAPKSALIGAGISAYRNAYQIFRPVWMNGTSVWQISFTQASAMPLTLITTMGIIGLLAWVLILVKFAHFYRDAMPSSKALTVFIAGSLLLNLFLPFNTVMLTLQAIAIAALVANESHKLPLLQMQALRFKMLNKPETINLNKKPRNLTAFLGSGISLAIVVAISYLVARSLQAHMLMFQSSRAVAENNIVRAYELQQRAVALNPFYDVFRRRYSSTSALIAIALSNKADISETDKQQVSALLQQSVTEARAATTLDGAESQNWANLAQIYNNLIGVSEDAVNWAVQSYVSAIETNPTDPLLRLDLASIFVRQESYQQALNIYDQAINLKADLPISHYRRGELLELVKTPEALREARLSYQRALVLLPANSEDYSTVNTKIEELEKYMKDNNISLEAPKEETAPTTGANAQQATEGETKLSAPSITEQNLNNTNTVNPDSEPVDVNNLSEETTPTPEPTAVPIVEPVP